MDTHFDTIAAPASPPVPCAVGILRISGPDAVRIAGQIFFPLGRTLADVPDRLMLTGVLKDGGSIFDRCMACVMRAPRSFSGEDVVELHLHGSPAIMTHALTLLYAAGARPAGPGEFTRRAIMNGKLDLLQAEAVADLIESRSALAARNAAAQLDGAVSRLLEDAWTLLTGVMAQVAACVDYPEDDVPDITTAQMLENLRRASGLLSSLGATYRRGLILRDGIRVVLAGRPNTGKSSLFNALLGFDRAIVTPVPGTTRDSIEATVTLNGLYFRLIDVAGIHETADVIEAEGVRRARKLLDDAHLVLVVLDCSCPLTDDDREILGITGDMPRVVAYNKTDLRQGNSQSREIDGAVDVSALTGLGMEQLAEALASALPPQDDPRRLADGETLITNARHAHALCRACEAVEECAAAIESGVPADAALVVLETALDALGELTGKRISDSVLEQIFSRFCVGK